MNPIDALSRILRPAERPAVCARCGRGFTQFQLRDSWLAEARRRSTLGRTPLIDRQVPGGWVPVYCPRCEHRDLSGMPSVDADAEYAAAEREGLREAV